MKEQMQLNVKEEGEYLGQRYPLSVVIVAQDNIEHTKFCIQSLFESAQGIDYELITVDNGSTDGTKEFLESLDNVKKISFNQNMSLADAFNSGWRMAEGELILLSCSNIIFTYKSIDNLVTCLKAYSDTGMVVPACNAASNNQQVNLGYNGFEEFYKAAEEFNKSDCNKWEERFKLEFYICMTRAEVLKKTGGFSGSYFSGDYEGFALSFKIRRENLKLIFAGDTYVHRWGADIEKSNAIQNRGEIDSKIFLSDFGIDLEEDKNLDFDLVNTINYTKCENINVLGIGSSFGGTLLNIKNRFTSLGSTNITLWYLSEEEKYSADLKTICDNVIYSNFEKLLSFYERNQFDCIVIDEVLQQLSNPEKLIKDIKEILKPKGQLIFKMDNDCYYEYISAIINQEPDCNFKISCCTPQRINKILEECGYIDIKSSCVYDDSDKSAEDIVFIERIKNMSSIADKYGLEYKLCAKKLIYNVAGKNDFKKFLVYPGYDWILNDAIINEDSNRNRLGIETGKAPLMILKEELNKIGYELHSIDKSNIKDAEYQLFMDAPKSYNNMAFRHIYDGVYKGKLYFDECLRLKKNSNIKMILLIQEPVFVMPENYDLNLHKYFDAILTMNDDMVDNKKYFKYYNLQPAMGNILYSRDFKEKKLLTTISSNKYSNIPGELYSKRREAINYFDNNHPDAFDFYGRGWGNYKFNCYKGEIPGKLQIMSSYRFCICYENGVSEGYITEKIFDSFYSGCIPIYLGAPNVADFIPENTFIDKRKFDSYELLYDFISSMNEAEYQKYLKNINDFLSSESFSKFSYNSFVQNVINVIRSI